jgi:kinesin family protein 3/17
MMGIPSDETLRGIIPRSFSHIVNLIESARDRKFLVRCSYLEIYNEEIHDLLSADAKARRELKESTDKGIFIKDLTMCLVKTVDEMERNMNQGNKNRATAETQMNKDSSRSHSIFTLYIESS